MNTMPDLFSVDNEQVEIFYGIRLLKVRNFSRASSLTMKENVWKFLNKEWKTRRELDEGVQGADRDA